MANEVLNYFREVDPRFQDVPDEELTSFIADSMPEFLQDPDFAAHVEKTRAPLQPVSQQQTEVPASEQRIQSQAKEIEQLWGEPSGHPVDLSAERRAYEFNIARAEDDPIKRQAAQEAFRSAIAERGVTLLDKEEQPLKVVGQAVGKPIARGGKVLQATVGDLAASWAGMPADNLESFSQDPKAPLPIQQQVQDAEGWWRRAMGYIGLAGSQAPIYLGGGALGTAVGLPATASNLALMTFDEEGHPNPVGVAAALGLPAVDKFGRTMTAKALNKALDEVKVVRTELLNAPGQFAETIQGKAVMDLFKDRDQLVKFLEIAGGQFADNLYLAALQTPGVLSSDNPKEAALEAITSNLGTALMGVGELQGRARTETLTQLAQRAKRGEWPQVIMRTQTNPAEPMPGDSGPAIQPPPPKPPPTPPQIDPPPRSGSSLPPEVLTGKETVVVGANQTRVPAKYAWVPGDLIQGSHVGEMFGPNPAYAPLRNTRRYDEDAAEKEKVIQGAANWDPYSYATNVRSAADGPIMVSPGSDGVMRVLGGNGRWQMIQRLDPDQYEQFSQVQSEQASVFGLPPRPSERHVLVRLLPSTDVGTQEGLERASGLVDLLNPSPGLVETTASMARNDVPKLVPQVLQDWSSIATPAAAKSAIAKAIASGSLDRNTRQRVIRSDAEAVDYLRRVVVQAAYQDEAVTELARSRETTSTTRAMIERPVPVMLRLRALKEPKLADAMGEMIRRVVEYQGTGLKLDRALQQFHQQEDMFASPETAIARQLAIALAGQVERLPPNRRGERKIDAEETASNFDRFWDKLESSVLAADGSKDLLGQSRTTSEAVLDFVRQNVGDTPTLLREDDGIYTVQPDPRVKRLNKLVELAKTRKLTAAENSEQMALEADLGQNFMSFWTEQTAKMDEAKQKQLEQMEIRAKQQARLVADDLKSQGDLFGKQPEEPGGQFTLLEPELTRLEARRSVKRDARQLTLQFEGIPVQTLSGRFPNDLPGQGPQARPDWVARTGSESAVRLAVQQIHQELIQTGGVEIIGRKIRSTAEAAALFQTFRQPQFEILHWVFMRGDTVVGRHSISLRLPSAAYVFMPGKDTASILQLMREYQADGYYLTHNHPSGRPIPSNADQRATSNVALQVPGFRGHIVIDHTEFARIYSDGHYDIKTLPGVTGPDPLLAPTDNVAIGQDIYSAEGMAAVTKHLRRPEAMRSMVQIMMATTQYQVRAFAEIHEADVAKPDVVDQLRRVALGQGAPYLRVYYEGNNPEVRNQLVDWFMRGVVKDVLVPQGSDSLVSVAQGWSRPVTDTFVGQPITRDMAIELKEEEQRPAYEFSYGPLDRKTGNLPKVPVTLGHMDKIRPADMPELVKLARDLLGHVPQIRKLPKARGVMTAAEGGHATIKLSPGIFTDPIAAAKTLAHEIGHLIDFLPERTMARGNLFGRIASLRDFLRTTFPTASTTPQSKILTPKDRQRIRREAERKVGPRPPKDEETDLAAWQNEVRAEYADLIEGEIHSRGLSKIQEIRDELWALSQEWRPLPADLSTVPQSYMDYRMSGEELYADALSAMLNSPGVVEDLAPLFYRMFWDYLDRKPEVKQQLFDLQDLLQRGKVNLLDVRRDSIHQMFAKGEERMRYAAEERERRANSWAGFWTAVGNELVDRFWAVKRKTNAAGDGHAQRVLDEFGFRDNVNMQLVRQVFETVVKPVEDAGMTTEMIGEVLLLERIMAGDRATMANPGGQTPLTARSQLWKLRHDIGLDKWTLLKAAVDKFHQLAFSVAKRAVEVGAYNRETFDTIIAPNKDTYAAFAVVDYLEDYVSPAIRQQIGTFNDVANPFTATLLKTVALNNLINWQLAKRTALTMLQTHFPGEVEPAEMVGPYNARKAKRHPEKGVLELLVNGKPESFYVDPYIAQAFEEVPAPQLWPILRVLDTAFRRYLYPLIITYNPGFMFVTSPLREVRRTGRNLPIRFGRLKLLREYARVWKDSLARHKGIATPLTREMEGTLALSTPFDTVASLNRDDSLERLMQRYKLIGKTETRGRVATAISRVAAWPFVRVVANPVRRLASVVEFYGMVIDALPKYAAYNILKREVGMNPKEAATWVRSYAGLPNITNKGRSYQLTRALVPFWNVFMQGWRADAKLATNPKTRSGYWFRWGMQEGFWTVLQALAAAGVLGAGLKAIFDGVSEHNKTNSTILPLGILPGGDYGQKSVFLAVPRDETDRVLSGMAYKLITATLGDKPSDGIMAEASSLLDFGGGQVPGLNPVLTTALKWKDYATGIQPMDPQRGRPIVPDRQWKAGGLDGLAPMANWTLSQGRLNIWSHDATQGRTVELFTENVPILNRFLRVSDYGHKERQIAVDRLEESKDARRRLSYDKDVQSLASEYEWLRGLKVDGRTEVQQDRYQSIGPWYNGIYRKMDEEIETLEGEGDRSTAATIRRQLTESATELKRER